MLYLIPHPKFPYSSDLCIWHVHFWLQWLSSSTCLLVACTVDHSVWTSLILPLDLLDLHPQVILGRHGHCLSVSVHARDTAAHGSSWWCQIHHHWPVLVPPLPDWHCHCLRSQITTTLQAELEKRLPATYLPHHCIVHTTLLVHSQIIALWANYFY